MSGHPNPNGVQRLKQSFAAYEKKQKLIEDFKNQIRSNQQTVKEEEDALHQLYSSIKGQLHEMDVSSPGNYGWENRYFNLLAIMSRNHEGA